MDCECKSVFNSLSKADRVKLRGAALTKSITSLIRDDTKKRPWRYPFYAVYMITVATPLPFFGAGAALLAATAAWAKWELSPMAKELNQRIKESFNHAALVCAHKEAIVQDPENSEKHQIKNMKLAWETTKRSASDTWQATKHAFNALKNLSLS